MPCDGTPLLVSNAGATVTDIEKQINFVRMDIIPLINEIEASASPEKKEALIKQLAEYLNHLLVHDFAALVQVLYRVDVAEKKLKRVLHDHPEEDAGLLMAAVLVQRAEEKALARKKFQSPGEASGEERW